MLLEYLAFGVNSTEKANGKLRYGIAASLVPLGWDNFMARAPSVFRFFIGLVSITTAWIYVDYSNEKG